MFLVGLLIPTSFLIITSTNEYKGNVYASDHAVLRISPQNITGVSIDETFTVSIRVENVTNLYGFDVQLKWDPTILHCVSWELHVPVEDYPDGVLHQSVLIIKNMVDESDNIPDAEPGTMGWWAANSMAPAEPFTGNGTIATLTFQVVGTGNCKIEFVRSPTEPLLSDQSGSPIPMNIYDANFIYGGAPEAIFTYWPDFGVKNKPVTFNASQSYDPNGYITKYIWNFGDGETNTTSQPVTNHTYTETGEYTVSLTVQDNDDITSSPYEETVKIVEFRDLQILSVTPSKTFTLINDTINVEVKVSNLGEIKENCSITLYYNATTTSLSDIQPNDWKPIKENLTTIDENSEKTFNFQWNTTGLNKTEAAYYLLAQIKPLPYERNITDNTLISQKYIYITAKEIHDLAVLTPTVKATYNNEFYSAPIIIGEDAYIETKIYNNGTFKEANFTVAISINNTEVFEKNVTSELDVQQMTTVTYKWTEPSIGRYNITITVQCDKDENLANNVASTHLEVIDTPQLNITWTPKNPTVNQTITFSAAGSFHKDPRGKIINYTWTFIPPGGVGKRISETGENVSVSFPIDGNWTVQLVVTDSFGLTYSTRRDLSITYYLSEGITVAPIPPNLLLDYLIIASVIGLIILLVVLYVRRSRKLEKAAKAMFEAEEDDIIEF